MKYLVKPILMTHYDARFEVGQEFLYPNIFHSETDQLWTLLLGIHIKYLYENSNDQSKRRMESLLKDSTLAYLKTLFQNLSIKRKINLKENCFVFHKLHQTQHHLSFHNTDLLSLLPSQVHNLGYKFLFLNILHKSFFFPRISPSQFFQDQVFDPTSLRFL